VNHLLENQISAVQNISNLVSAVSCVVAASKTNQKTKVSLKFGLCRASFFCWYIWSTNTRKQNVSITHFSKTKIPPVNSTKKILVKLLNGDHTGQNVNRSFGIFLGNPMLRIGWYETECGGASSSSTTYRKQSVSVCVRVSFARYRAISSHHTVCHPKSVVFSRCEMNDERGGPYDANDSRRCDTDCGEHRHVEESIILMSGTAVRIVDRCRSVWVGIWVWVKGRITPSTSKNSRGGVIFCVGW